MTVRTDPDEVRPRVLIIVQNLSVPFDRRVWLECNALTAAGYDVTVVCPKGKGEPNHEVLEGVTLFRYRPYAPGGSALGFVLEYAYSFARDGETRVAREATRPLRRAAGLQPARHLLAHCPMAAAS